MRSFAKIAAIAREKIMSVLENIENPVTNLEAACQKQLEILHKLKDSLHSIRTARYIMEGQRAKIVYDLQRTRRYPYSHPNNHKHSLQVIERLEKEIKELKRKENELEALQIRIKTEIHYFGRQKDILIKRYEAAKAILETREAATTKEAREDIKALLEKLKDSALFVEARARAIDQLVENES